MQFNKLKTIAAAALSVAMLFSAAACGTSDKAGDSGSDKGGSSKSVTITSYDVSSVKKDDAIAALLPESVTKDGKLTIGTNPSYAPAEFLDADGARPRSATTWILPAPWATSFGLDTEIVSSNFDTIIPAIGSKYDLASPPSPSPRSAWNPSTSSPTSPQAWAMQWPQATPRTSMRTTCAV